MAKRYDWKRFREDHGLTQKELAEKLEITKPFMSNIESGKSQFPTDRLSKLTPYYPDVNFDNYAVPEDVVKNQSDNKDSLNINDPEFVKSITEMVTKLVLTYQSQERKNISEIEKITSRDHESLVRSNEKLRDILDAKNDKIEELNDKIAALQEQILALKTILVEHGISYQK